MLIASALCPERLASRLLIALSLALSFSCNLSTSAQNASTETFKVAPYLQLGDHQAFSTPEQLDVCWMSVGESDKWQVQSRLDGKSAWQEQEKPKSHVCASMYGGPAKRVLAFEGTIGGLTSGAPFQYRILKNGKEVFTATGEARKSRQQPFHFAVFGDMGANTPGQKEVAVQIFKNKPDFIMYAGDIVYVMGLLSEYFEKFFPIYNSDTASTDLGAPIMRSIVTLGVIGNHDVALGDNRNGVNLEKFGDNALAFYKVWSEPLNGPLKDPNGNDIPKLLGSKDLVDNFESSVGKKYPRMANYSFDYGNSHWLVLDANPYMDWKDETLRKWVADDLAKAKDATWKFVCFHQPGFSFDASHYKEQRMRLLSDVFENAGVDVVFSGHAHDYQRSYPLKFKAKREGGKLSVNSDGTVDGDFTFDKQYDGVSKTRPQGIIYLVTGAGGAPLYGPITEKNASIPKTFTLKFDSTHYCFTACDIDGPTLKVKQIAGDGSVVDSFTIEKSHNK
jgi:acid phosphatase type 7